MKNFRVFKTVKFHDFTVLKTVSWYISYIHINRGGMEVGNDGSIKKHKSVCERAHTEFMFRCLHRCLAGRIF